MRKAEIKELLEKYIEENLNKDEFQKVNHFLKNGLHSEIWEEVINDQSLPDPGDRLDDISKYNLLNRIIQSNRKSFNKWVRVQSVINYAAVLVMIVGLSWSLYHHSSQQQNDLSLDVAYVEKINEKGRKTTFNLPDGTIVKLNSSSKLKFPLYFSGNKREVMLEGEAYFEVVRDESNPFIIRSGNIITTVLGTSFNIKAHQESDNIQVAVVSGKVKVESISENSEAGNEKSVLLTQNKKAVYEKNKASLTTSILEEEDIAWKDGIILFKNANEADVVRKLEEWYNVRFSIQNQGNENWDLTAKFKNETLEHTLRVIGHQIGFTFSIEEKNVSIKYQ